MRRVLVLLLFVVLVILSSLWADASQLKPALRSSPAHRGSASQDASDDDEPVRLESNLVNLLLTVRDSENRLVRDLKKHEVLVTEESVPQAIAFFARRDALPLVLAIAVDFSGSQQWRWSESCEAVQQFLGQVFRPGHDYVALASFRSTVQLHTGLTSRQQRISQLVSSLARTDTGYARQGTALYDAIFVLTDEVLDGPIVRRIAGEHHDMIQRALLVLTDGYDTASVHSATDAVTRAQRAGVAVYAIGIGDAFGQAGIAHESLDQVCRETGGRAYYPRQADDLKWAFRQIAEELTTQYALAFYVSAIRRDDAVRPVRVQIIGRPNLSVRWRRGYETRPAIP